jgi:predicted esterase
VLAVPQSVQPTGVGVFGWEDGEASAAQLAEAWTTLQSEHDFDPERVVVGGFSQGGRLAVQTAVTGTPIPCRGLIGMGAGIPQLDRLRPFMEPAAERGLRVVFVIGQHDHLFPSTMDLHEALVASGVRSDVRPVPGLGHLMPTDFGPWLLDALETVLEG